MKPIQRTFIVTGANGDIAISIAEVLRAKFPTAHLIGTDIEHNWPVYSIFDQFNLIPRADENSFVNSLYNLQSNFPGSIIIPTSEPELRFLAKTDQNLSHLNLLINNSEIILYFMDKLKSIEWLNSIGIPGPNTKHLKDATSDDLPVMVKPRFGSGSRGLEIIRDEAHLTFAKHHRNDDPVAQEFLAGVDEEYTCALLTLKVGYRAFIMRRLLKGDVTIRIQPVKNPEIETILMKIAESIPAHSFINVQLRLTNKGPMIFEINPRFSSTVKMRNLLDFPDLIWALELYQGMELSAAKPNYHAKVFRTYKEIITDQELRPISQ